MTSGVAGLVDAYAPPDVRDGAPRRAARRQLRVGDRRVDVPHRTRRWLRPRPTPCTAPRATSATAACDRRREVVLLERRRRGDRAARPARGRARRLGRARPVPRARPPRGRLAQHFTIRRLKDKLGTKSVPTAEVEFHGALGYALRAQPGDGAGTDARGLNRMMEMVNGSRFGVAMMGLGIARRCFLESAIWAHHRRVRGRLLVDLPLVREQLVDLLVELEAAMALGFECAVASRRDDGDACAASSSRPRRRGCAGSGSRPRARRRAVRRQRLLRGLGPDPPAARRAVPPDLGGQRERLRARRAARHAQRRRPRGGPRAHRRRARDRARWSAGVRRNRPRTPSHGARDALARRIDEDARARPRRVRGAERGARDALVETMSAALLLEQAVDDPRKGSSRCATRAAT